MGGVTGAVASVCVHERFETPLDAAIAVVSFEVRAGKAWGEWCYAFFSKSRSPPPRSTARTRRLPSLGVAALAVAHYRIGKHHRSPAFFGGWEKFGVNEAPPHRAAFIPTRAFCQSALPRSLSGRVSEGSFSSPFFHSSVSLSGALSVEVMWLHVCWILLAT